MVHSYSRVARSNAHMSSNIEQAKLYSQILTYLSAFIGCLWTSLVVE